MDPVSKRVKRFTKPRFNKSNLKLLKPSSKVNDKKEDEREKDGTGVAETKSSKRSRYRIDNTAACCCCPADISPSLAGRWNQQRAPGRRNQQRVTGWWIQQRRTGRRMYTRDSGMDAIPSWLDTDFFQTVLRATAETTDAQVTQVQVQPSDAKGDNLGSSLYRATIHFQVASDSLTIHLIIKCLSPGEFFRHLLIKMGVFKRELHLYKFTLPAMYSLMKKLPQLHQAVFSAKQFFTSRNDTLILEDLTSQGFSVVSRRQQLDEEHSIAALRALGMFHALSMILYIKVPASMESFKESFYIEDRRDVIAQYLEPSLRSLSNVVQKWIGFERFGKKLRKVECKAVDCIIDVVKAKKGALCVLNHGDFWINNILFKRNCSSNEMIEVRFVDFQSSRFASPALDLQYFLYTSPQENVRAHSSERLLREYHAAVGNTLGLLGYGDYLFSMDQLNKEMRDKAFYGLISACTDLASVLEEPDGNLFKQTFQRLLLHFEMMGVL